MSDFFSDYQEEGASQVAGGEYMDRIAFSGKDGEYTWKEDDVKKSEREIEKVILFWHLDGQVLWGGNGPIPNDGDAPLCRNEKRNLDIAGLRKGLGVATLATLMQLGYTGRCEATATCKACGLGQFRGNDKPLCKQSAVLYVADPGVAAGEFDEKTIHRVEFNGPAVIKALKDRIAALLKTAKEAGVPHAAFVVKFGREKVKVKGKADTYNIPTLAIHPDKRMDSDWIAIAGTFAREALEDSRRRPPGALDPKEMLAEPAMQAALKAPVESVEMVDIPF